MRLWRIASATRAWRADDLSGAGAAAYPGRWNEAGQAVVYAAPSLALAVLETAAHVDDAGLPLNRYVVAIDVPPALWAHSRETHTADTLPAAWDAIPAASASVDVGSAWFKRGGRLLLEVPSVLVPEESILVINAEHPGAAKLTARIVRRYEYNALFRG